MFRLPRCLTLAVLVALGTGFAFSAQAPQGKKYAILVGVNEYDSAQFSPLKWAVNDAVELGDLLKAQGFEVEVLYSGGKVPPTVANIHARLGVLLDKCKRHDTVFVAFAGHGVQLEKEKPTDLDDAYFCPQDARIAAGKRGTLVSLRQLYQQLDESGAGVKLLVVDACRDLSKIPRGAKRSLDGASYVVPPKGTAALFSCSAGQSAYELQALKHGLFFHTLLEGLRGKAAIDGQVTWDSLQLYVRTRVPQDVVKLTGDPEARQTPSLCSSELAGQPPILAITAKLNLPRPTPAASPKYLELDLGGVTMKLVRIEPGTFLMGSPTSEEARTDTESHHEVEITKPFYMGIHEVTQKQYERVMRQIPARFSALGLEEYTVRGLDTTQFPVEMVSWHDAMQFCQKVSALSQVRNKGWQVDLPTEAEWEYCCRAGKKTPFFFGDTISTDQANYHGDLAYGKGQRGTVRRRPTPAGSFAPNDFGLYDMHGNVWEWCKDWYAADYYSKSPKQDPAGPDFGTNRVVRGGCCFSFPGSCRSASRSHHEPNLRDNYCGFRVVLSLP